MNSIGVLTFMLILTFIIAVISLIIASISINKYNLLNLGEEEEQEEEEEEDEIPPQPIPPSSSSLNYKIRTGKVLPTDYFNIDEGTMLLEESLGNDLNPNPFGYGIDIYFRLETFISSNIIESTGRPVIMQTTSDGGALFQRSNTQTGVTDVWTNWNRIG